MSYSNFTINNCMALQRIPGHEQMDLQYYTQNFTAQARQPSPRPHERGEASHNASSCCPRTKPSLINVLTPEPVGQFTYKLCEKQQPTSPRSLASINKTRTISTHNIINLWQQEVGMERFKIPCRWITANGSIPVQRHNSATITIAGVHFLTKSSTKEPNLMLA